MQFEVRLVHAEPGRRVVEARALDGGRLLANALGEADQAEEAEERALKRLGARLANPGQPPAAAAAVTATATATAATNGQVSAMPARQPGARPSPPAAPPASEPGNAPASEAKAEPWHGSETDAGDDPASDPDDWSAELARVDLALRRLGWEREQEGLYLERAFGHPSRSRITRYADLLAYLRHLEGLESGADPSTAAVPLRRRDLLQQGDALLSGLGWGVEQARSFLRSQLALSSRSQLSDTQLLQFNLLLEAELLAGPGSGSAAADGADAADAPVAS